MTPKKLLKTTNKSIVKIESQANEMELLYNLQVKSKFPKPF